MRYVMAYDYASVLSDDNSCVTILDTKKNRVLYAGDPKQTPKLLEFWVGLGLVFGYTRIVVESGNNA